MSLQAALGQSVSGPAVISTDGTNLLTAVLVGLHLITLNNTVTVTFNSTGETETQYNTSGSTIAALTINLPTVTVPGQTVSYASKSAVTAVTLNGTVAYGAALTAMTANQVVSYRAVDNAGTFIRIS